MDNRKTSRPFLSTAYKTRIVELRTSGLSVTNTVRKMADEGVEGISRMTVYNIMKKWNELKTVAPIPHPVRERQGVTLELLDFIDKEMEKDDELTSVTLQRRISKQFSVEFSVSKVKDLRKKLGWLAEKTRYCQMVRQVNRAKRKTYAEECLLSKEQFDDVIFSDECNIQLETNGTITFHRWWEPCPQKGKPKHPFHSVPPPPYLGGDLEILGVKKTGGT